MKNLKTKKAQNTILITSSNFPFGGPSANVLRLLTTGFVKNGRNVSVIIQRGKQFGKRIRSDKRKGNIDGVHYLYCGYLLRPENCIKKMIDNLAGLIVPLLVLLKKKSKNEIDCVLLYTSSAYECIIPFIICKILKIPIINHVVEWYEKEMIVTTWWKLLKWWDFLVRMKILNKYFDGLIVASQFLQKYYTDRNIDEKRILVLPNLLDTSIFDIKKENIASNKKIVRIGYCGFPTKKDGVNDLLSAFQIVHRKNSDIELLVIGDAADGNSLLPGLKKISKKLEIFENVIFTGLVEWRKIPKLLHSCDILVLARPSGKFAEAGFPTKLGEYMACKKPVVVTKVGDIPVYLRDNENIILAEPDNPSSVASRICYLINNRKKARAIGENGYLWAKTKLDYIKATKAVGCFLNTFVK